LLTNIEPEDFVFKLLEHGKPVLNNNARFTDITFNVSHSNDLALIAVAQKQNIGIDIEKINHEANHQALMTRFFSKAEQTEFQIIPDTNMARAFCACWTRKEAFIKAVGDGVSYGLDKFDVTVNPENQTPEINLHKPSKETWSAINLPINDEYMACLVSNRDSLSVRCWC
jgi:4'-phosphopantetheinyl transferase